MSCYDRYDRSALQVFQKRLMIKTRFAAQLFLWIVQALSISQKNDSRYSAAFKLSRLYFSTLNVRFLLK